MKQIIMCCVEGEGMAKTNAVIIEFVTAGRWSPVRPLINFDVYADYLACNVQCEIRPLG